MKRRLTLAQKLTASIALAVIIQTIFVFGSFISYFRPRLEKNTYSMIQRGAQSSAELYASRWSYEILAAKTIFDGKTGDKELNGLIQETIKENPGVSGIAVYSVKDASKDSKEIVSLKKRTEELVRVQFADMDYVKFLGTVNDFEKNASVVDGDFVISGAPVHVENKVEAYLVYSESIEKYNQAGKTFSIGMSLVVVFFMLLQLVAIFWIGSRNGRPLMELAKTASQIAAGDLTRGISIDKEAVSETAILSQAISEMSTAIHEQVSLVKTLTIQASGVSKDVAKAMSHLASSATEQAAAVSQTASTVEEMEKSGKSVAEAVKRIVEAAERSAEASTRGRQAVDMASSIIVKIKDDSGNISMHSRSLLSSVEEVGNIINSVNSIAEQSKILAVNASIEAAKAGEYGSGFAVVAQEVKNLAGQSKDATEQITRTLTSIRQSVEGMVRLARDGEERTTHGVSSIANTGAIVNDLSDAIQEASEVANEIDSAVGQQSLGLSQIASAMDEINISASENQQISYQMEKSTVEMTHSLEELSVLVDVWTTLELMGEGEEAEEEAEEEA